MDYLNGWRIAIPIYSCNARTPGIPETEAERLLPPFTRIDASRTDKAGSGLRLAIVDKIAKPHGRNIQLLPRTGEGLEARVSLQFKLKIYLISTHVQEPAVQASDEAFFLCLKIDQSRI